MVTIETHKSKITQAREESLHELVEIGRAHV